MVLYLVRIDVPSNQAEAFSRYQAGHVAKTLAAMGRSAVGMRAKARTDADSSRFYWFFELASFSALEAYLISREQEELSTELAAAFPDAKILRTFGEQAGAVRRGMRFGEDAGAAFVLDIAIPKDKSNGWTTWHDEEHLPRVLSGNGFIKARRYELHDGEDQSHHLVVYDAVNLDSVRSFQEEEGKKLASEHDKHAPIAKLEASTWEWMREAEAGDQDS